MTGLENGVAIALADVSKHYGRLAALDRLDVELEPGLVHGLLGPNGSGKSTCLHLITGLLQPTRGTVHVNGHPAGSVQARAVTGFAPDDLPLPLTLTGYELLQFHDRLRGRDDLTVTGLTLAATLGIADSLDRQIGEYSHGMRRKVQLVAATMHRPRLLVLDEPFRGLDPEAAAALREIIHTVPAYGGTVLIATHDMVHAELDCANVLILAGGRQVALGSPVELLAACPGARNLEDVFFSTTGLLSSQEERLASIRSTLNSKE